jgi:thiol-disulfide isomerase/thioredoxin
VDVAALRGSVVVVMFWATWSPPSTAIMSKLVNLAGEVRRRNVLFVGVNLDQSREAAIDYIRARRIPWPNYCDVRGRTNDLAVQWGVSDLPYFLVIDREGKLVDAGTGDRATLEALLERLAPPPVRP